jgi:hypothetical protein
VQGLGLIVVYLCHDVAGQREFRVVLIWVRVLGPIVVLLYSDFAWQGNLQGCLKVGARCKVDNGACVF